MVKVKIAFMERFRHPLINDTKIWTSRTKQKGKRGDTFEAFGHEFLIEKVESRLLYDVANHWKEEGCSSSFDFIEVWNIIHWRKGFVGLQRVFVHVFRRIRK